MFHKFKNNKSVFYSMIRPNDYIIIDEVSMMPEMFYQLFIMVKRTFDNIKFIVVGDFNQLPPVMDSWNGDYKSSAALHSLCDGNRLQLTQCRRANSELFELCKNVESIDLTKFEVKKYTYLNLAYKHETRMQVNNVCMNTYLAENNINNYISIEKSNKNEKTQDVKLCKGMPIIAHKTNKKLEILNSERFTINSITQEAMIINDDFRELEIKTTDFHKYFYLGFCITVHSSQGETFNEPYTIHDWNFIYFCNRAKYVALSRATDIKNIQICR